MHQAVTGDAGDSTFRPHDPKQLGDSTFRANHAIVDAMLPMWIIHYRLIVGYPPSSFLAIIVQDKSAHVKGNGLRRSG